jgi:hypothetical protein
MQGAFASAHLLLFGDLKALPGRALLLRLLRRKNHNTILSRGMHPSRGEKRRNGFAPGGI